MAVICLNCDGWGCAQCANEREAARGGEQGLTALELELGALKSKLDQLATAALAAIAGAGIATPAEGYVAAPHCLAWDIAKLVRSRDQERARADELLAALREQTTCCEYEARGCPMCLKAHAAIAKAEGRPDHRSVGFDANGSEVAS